MVISVRLLNIETENTLFDKLKNIATEMSTLNNFLAVVEFSARQAILSCEKSLAMYLK